MKRFIFYMSQILEYKTFVENDGGALSKSRMFDMIDFMLRVNVGLDNDDDKNI